MSAIGMANSNLLSATIAAAAATSGAIECNGGKLVGVIIPSGWTTACVELQGSIDGTNYYDVLDSLGNYVQIVATAGKMSMAAMSEIALLNYIKLRSANASTHADVAQTNGAVVGVIFA